MGDPSAVDDELGACDVGGLVGGEVEDAVGYLLGLADAAHGDLGEHLLAELLIVVHVLAVMGVSMGPGWTELQRMLSWAWWMAMDLVKMRTEPLEAW